MSDLTILLYSKIKLLILMCLKFLLIIPSIAYALWTLSCMKESMSTKESILCDVVKTENKHAFYIKTPPSLLFIGGFRAFYPPWFWAYSEKVWMVTMSKKTKSSLTAFLNPHAYRMSSLDMRYAWGSLLSLTRLMRLTKWIWKLIYLVIYLVQPHWQVSNQ